MTRIDSQIQVMRDVMVRDAAILEALAHPRIIHCTVCDHEWCNDSPICDWCGNAGKELKSNE